MKKGREVKNHEELLTKLWRNPRREALINGRGDGALAEILEEWRREKGVEI